MRKIIIGAITVLVLPLLTILVVWMSMRINVFDNPDFWYGYMAYFGSVILGAIALVQSQKANDTNDRLMEMQQEQQSIQVKEKASLIAFSPVIINNESGEYVVNDDDYADEFDIVNQKYQYYFFIDCDNVIRDNRQLFNVVIEVENLSPTPLMELRISGLRIFDIITNVSDVSDEKESVREYWYADDEGHTANLLLRTGETIQLCLKIGMDEYELEKESFHIGFNITSVSVYNVEFTESVVLFRNNVVDTRDRVFVSIKESWFYLKSEQTGRDVVSGEMPKG